MENEAIPMLRRLLASDAYMPSEIEDEIRAILERRAPEPSATLIDIDADSWKAIKDAAGKSPWIPKEYYMNDWVSDVCQFLLSAPDRDQHP